MGNSTSSFREVMPIEDRGVRLEVEREVLNEITDDHSRIAKKNLGKEPSSGRLPQAESQLHKMVKTKGIPYEWLDSFTMQCSVPHEDKGWLVKVYWNESPIPGAGCGVFSAQELEPGTVARRLIFGQNLMKISSKADFPPGPWSKKWIEHYGTAGEDITIHLPGTSINHSEKGNVFFEATEHGVDEVITKRVQKGEELLVDYNTFGEFPQWFLEEMAGKHNRNFLEAKH